MQTKVLHKPTGLIFSDRKQAKIMMGHGKYNKAIRERQMVFLSQYSPADLVM